MSHPPLAPKQLELNTDRVENNVIESKESTFLSTGASSTIHANDAVKSEVACGYSGTVEEIENRKRFACPYRKHNPKKYTHYNWRSCALSGFGSTARVK